MPLVLRAKCLIIGDSCVGKSAIVQCFHSDGTHYPKTYTMTTGVEVCVKSVTLPECSVEFYLHDSAGKEVFSEHVVQLWDHPSMLLLVYDITNKTSFRNCTKWLERARAQKPEQPFPVVLLGNRKDLSTRREVSEKEGQELANENDLAFFECSAL
ncbi:intraflagellar transport protein 27 homolog isoform X2 [Dysidea avara]|uniref:intraflagellar transport protein 27 homolog isoform X2 n=1 Tax=Dysidea avara TaxID=196820 RepID=UPI0033232599